VVCADIWFSNVGINQPTDLTKGWGDPCKQMGTICSHH
jgi:hypothetical protein